MSIYKFLYTRIIRYIKYDFYRDGDFGDFQSMQFANGRTPHLGDMQRMSQAFSLHLIPRATDHF